MAPPPAPVSLPPPSSAAAYSPPADAKPAKKRPPTTQRVHVASPDQALDTLKEFGPVDAALAEAAMTRLRIHCLAPLQQREANVEAFAVLTQLKASHFESVVKAMTSHPSVTSVQEAGCELVFLLCSGDHEDVDNRRQLAVDSGMFGAVAEAIASHVDDDAVVESSTILVLRLTDGSASFARQADKAGLTSLMRSAAEERPASRLTSRLDIAFRWLSLHGDLFAPVPEPPSPVQRRSKSTPSPDRLRPEVQPLLPKGRKHWAGFDFLESLMVVCLPPAPSPTAIRQAGLDPNYE